MVLLLFKAVFTKKYFLYFLLCIFINEKAISREIHEIPFFNIMFESPDDWSFLGGRVYNKAYTAIFKVADSEGPDKKYGRAIYLRATRIKNSLESFFRSKKISIENSKNSKIIYESNVLPSSEEAFLFWSYFDNANKLQYMTAERILVRDEVILRIVGAWPMLENCKAQRVHVWLGNMDKLFSSVKMKGVAISDHNPLTMGMRFSNDELESLMQPLCQ